MNQHYFDVPFGFAGDVTAIPDPLQTGGSVSMTEGWNFNYQRDLSTDPAALPIDRSTMNWLLLQITTAVQALQQQGVPEFINAAQNGGVAFSYGKGAVTLWSASGNAPFTKFVSLTAGNTNIPSLSDPTGATTGWQIVCDPIATSAQASAGTDNASIITPLLLAQQTALRAMLAGNSSQVFNVGTATAPTHAPQLQQMTGRLLRVTIYKIVSGVQNIIQITGGVSTGPTTTGATSFTRLTNTVFAEWEIQAAGGSGAGGSGAAAGNVCLGAPGASGSYVKLQLTAAQMDSIAASLAVTVGIGPNGTAGAAGTTGGTSSVTGMASCAGGLGGALFNNVVPPNQNGNGTRTAAPTVTIGTIVESGRGGAEDISIAISVNSGTGGAGGSSKFGNGALKNGFNTNGFDAANYGTGGGGTCINQTGGIATGGKAFDGIVICREYA